MTYRTDPRTVAEDMLEAHYDNPHPSAAVLREIDRLEDEVADLAEDAATCRQLRCRAYSPDYAYCPDHRPDWVAQKEGR